MGENKRILYLDYARVFTALLVIYGHLYTPSDSNWVRILIYQFHMPLFFIISGMLHKYTGAIQWKKYFRTILVPAIFFIFLHTIFIFTLNETKILPHRGWIYTTIFRDSSTLKNFIHWTAVNVISFCKGEGMLNGPCWFLFALFWCKLFTDISERLRSNPFVHITIIAIWIIAFAVVIVTGRKYVYLGQAIIAIPYYFIGFKGKSIIDKSLHSKFNLAFFMVSFTLLIIATGINGIVSTYAIIFGKMRFPANILFFYLAGLSGTYVVLFISSTLKRASFISKTSNSLITVLGIQSLFIYIIESTLGINKDYFLSIAISIVVYTLCVLSHTGIVKIAPWAVGKNKITSSKVFEG